MKQRAKLLKSLLFIWSMLLLSCQTDETQEISGENNSVSPIVSKPFTDFKKLPDLLSEAL
ncbi:hypothetical protein H9W95_16945 [Flavobacterium lindanitolerans]|nr:hypothetical protein [Flavobacterium lindanitolerans]